MSLLEKNFNDVDFDEIYKLTKSVTITDNFEKADILSAKLKHRGFLEAGCGTNRIAFTKNDYIFKIALDGKGIRDNNNEMKMTKALKDYVSKCYENNGIISVHEKVNVMDKFDMETNMEKVVNILKILSNRYILNDIGPASFLNWGFNDDGEPIIIDYGYIRPITRQMNFTCRLDTCDGRLKYKEDFSGFECDKCEKSYLITEVAGDGKFIEECSIGDDCDFDGYNTDCDVDERYLSKSSNDKQSAEQKNNELVNGGTDMKIKDIIKNDTSKNKPLSINDLKKVTVSEPPSSNKGIKIEKTIKF